MAWKWHGSVRGSFRDSSDEVTLSTHHIMSLLLTLTTASLQTLLDPKADPPRTLMDVPDFTEELIDKVSNQSDDQSGKYSIDELMQKRDDNLVDF